MSKILSSAQALSVPWKNSLQVVPIPKNSLGCVSHYSPKKNCVHMFCRTQETAQACMTTWNVRYKFQTARMTWTSHMTFRTGRTVSHTGMWRIQSDLMHRFCLLLSNYYVMYISESKLNDTDSIDVPGCVSFHKTRVNFIENQGNFEFYQIMFC